MYFTNFHSNSGSFQWSFGHLISLVGAQMNGSSCGCTLWSVVFSVPVASGLGAFHEVQGLISDVLNLLILLPGPLASSAESLYCGI